MKISHFNVYSIFIVASLYHDVYSFFSLNFILLHFFALNKFHKLEKVIHWLLCILLLLTFFLPTFFAFYTFFSFFKLYVRWISLLPMLSFGRFSGKSQATLWKWNAIFYVMQKISVFFSTFVLIADDFHFSWISMQFIQIFVSWVIYCVYFE